MIIREPSRDRPRVVVWWFAYVLVVVAVYLVAALGQVVELGGGSGADLAGVWFTLVFHLLLAVFHGAGPFLPRGRGTWIYGIVQLSLSMLCSCGFCLPFALPLLIFWVRGDCRHWFEGRGLVEDVVEVFD